MSTPFLSSEEYDERAHQMYNEGQYDEALETLREGLSLYPNAVELHVGVGYARLAREEYAWARRSFEEALVLDPEHEDALAGLGETLLRFGQPAHALKSFRRILELGYEDDVDLMMQVGRALFRDAMLVEAREFFETAVQQSPESAEAVASVGYVQHRLGEEEQAVATLRKSLQLDPDYSEARVYLGNIFYDRGEYEAALYHFERTDPEEHWDELGIWRMIELKKSLYRLKDEDAEVKLWEERLGELAGDPNDIDEMLAEIEQRMEEQDEVAARGQLELFGALLNDLAQHKTEDEPHRILTREGSEIEGTWEDIVRSMKDSNVAFRGRSLLDFMVTEARKNYSLTGVQIPTADFESFVRGSANAGLLRIVQ